LFSRRKPTKLLDLASSGWVDTWDGVGGRKKRNSLKIGKKRAEQKAEKNNPSPVGSLREGSS
jgi:hypothetical protein